MIILNPSGSIHRRKNKSFVTSDFKKGQERSNSPTIDKPNQIIFLPKQKTINNTKKSKKSQIVNRYPTHKNNSDVNQSFEEQITSKPSTVIPPDGAPLFVLDKEQKELEFMEEKLE